MGRLIVVNYEKKDKTPFSYGIDENTALIYDDNIKIRYIEGNDKYNVETNEFMLAENKSTTKGYEYLNINNPMTTGVFSWRGSLNEFLSYGLVDNKSRNEIKSFSYDNNGNGVALIFKKAEDTQGYWGQNGAADIYSFKNVRLDIKSIKIQMVYSNTNLSPLK